MLLRGCVCLKTIALLAYLFHIHDIGLLKMLFEACLVWARINAVDFGEH